MSLLLFDNFPLLVLREDFGREKKAKESVSCRISKQSRDS